MCRQSKRFLQQFLRRFHLPQQLIADCQKSEIVRPVPVVFRGDVFSAIVGLLELVGFAEFSDGFLNASRPAKFMSAHVVRVRD